MKIIVTGAAGFVGSHTVELLEKNGNRVMAVDNFSTGKTENLKKFKGIIYPANVADAEVMEIAFRDFAPDCVLHLAAQSAISISNSNPKLDLNTNVLGTLNMIEMSKKYKVSRFVFSSTSAVYRETRPFFGNGIDEKYPCEPKSPYGISKLAAEHYIRAMLPKNHIILRYGNIYGPRQVPIGENQIIPHIFRHFLFGDDFRLIYDGSQKRDFIFVKDVAKMNEIAINSSHTGTFNVATGVSNSINNILHNFEIIYGVVGYNWERSNKKDPRGSVFMNVNKSYSELGWKAYTSLSEGLKLTSEWWEKKS